MVTLDKELDGLRHRLLRLAPELENMATGMVQNNPDYAEVIDTPLRLIYNLSEGSDETLEEACRGYVSFCHTFFEKQVDFVRTQQYRASSYEQVKADVYDNASYMKQVYYPALLLSYLFSSNYFHIYRNFRERFLPLIADAVGDSCEIGIGHGLLSGTMLAFNRRLTGYGLDISPMAAEVAGRTSSFFNLASPMSIRVEDATEHIPLENGRGYRVMICAEVLEHLPSPSLVLRNMHAAMASDGILFLTASINMESVDHLYLFRSDTEVHQMVRDCGFEIVNQDLAFLTAKPYQTDPQVRKKLIRQANPCTAILVVQKN